MGLGSDLAYWYEDELKQLDSAWSSLSRATAYGIRLRFGDAGDKALAKAWREALSEKEVSDLIRKALCLDIEDLRQQLRHIEHMITVGDADAQALTYCWVRQRDNLESFSYLFPENDVLASTLSRLDEEAATFHSMWTAIRPFKCPPVKASPQVWWHKFAV